MVLKELQTLAASQSHNKTLEQAFYASEAVYRHDIQNYWNKTWIWAGHECQIPKEGDFFLMDYGPESLIIARDREGQVGAFLNVCRHRGSRVCLERSGNRRVFACPYHAWTYELNGALRSAKEMGEGFDPAQYGLLKAHAFLFEGLIFVSTAEQPPEYRLGLERLKPLVEPYGLRNLKLAATKSYPVRANWKLAVENYMECYHCGPAHKEYARSHSLKDPEHMTTHLLEALKQRSCAVGLSDQELYLSPNQGDPVGIEFYYKRSPLFEGYETGSQSGRPLAPLLGTLEGFDGGAADMEIGLLNNFLIYSDHMVGYRFFPKGLQDTDIEVTWFVRADAEAGRDYDLEQLTWLWDVTSQDDERIIRLNQEGVNSFHYRPGPLAEMEWAIFSFYEDYLASFK